MFYSLEDKDLIDSYKKAVALKLEKDFILLLEKALSERGLSGQQFDEKIKKERSVDDAFASSSN